MKKNDDLIQKVLKFFGTAFLPCDENLLPNSFHNNIVATDVIEEVPLVEIYKSGIRKKPLFEPFDDTSVSVETSISDETSFTEEFSQSSSSWGEESISLQDEFIGLEISLTEESVSSLDKSVGSVSSQDEFSGFSTDTESVEVPVEDFDESEMGIKPFFPDEKSESSSLELSKNTADNQSQDSLFRHLDDMSQDDDSLFFYLESLPNPLTKDQLDYGLIGVEYLSEDDSLPLEDKLNLSDIGSENFDIRRITVAQFSKGEPLKHSRIKGGSGEKKSVKSTKSLPSL